MVTRKLRQAKIIELLNREKMHNQSELVEGLRRFGIVTTQATLSRDLKELAVVKTRDGYEIIAESESPENREGLKHSIREFVKAVDASGNMVVVKTDPGNAPTVAVALDKAAWPEILGTVAGEDTLFALVKKPALVRKVKKRLEEMLQ